MVTTPVISTLAVQGDRLMATLTQLAKIGGLPNGGVQRLAFSPEDLRARSLVKGWMQTSGMAVRTDAAGNLIGRYPGKFPDAPALATGSHLDTVPNAGHYDGVYGVLAGLECVRVLHERQIRLEHSLDVIVFADEERTMVGCKAMAGQLSPDPENYRHPDGTSIQDCLARIGGCWEAIHAAQRTPEDLAAFVELHVEQGPVLEAAQAEIGVVTGIVGQRRYWITVAGSPRHAGTTPMVMRQDALLAASLVVVAVNKIGCMPGDQVATVGHMQVSPNVANTVPGLVEMTLDIRDLSNDRLDELIALLKAELQTIATATGTQIHLAQRLRNEPAPANSHIQAAIAEVCRAHQLSTAHLPSRASHDAQEMATITDMGMIFVPSQGGVSHAETEYTAPQQCVQGATVLLHTLLNLDQHYRCSPKGEYGS